MGITVGRGALADHPSAEVPDAHCCQDLTRCGDCQATFDEVRAARRDALIHVVTSVRPRRALR